MKKILKWTVIVLGLMFGLTVLAGAALYPGGMERFNRTYPDISVETVSIPTSADAIAHGEHIAIIWECTKCHGENLGGSLLANDPFLGTIPASNLTSGKGGIAQTYTDADWVRAIRHAVKPDSRVEVFMYDYYSTMSDGDLGDLIAYLKQLPPVNAEYPALHVGPIVAIAPAIGLFPPAAETIDHGAPRPSDPLPGATREYGEYLSELCTNCHGESLAGAVKDWSQDDFTRAIQTSVLPNGRKMGGIMSSKTFTELKDTELSALWLYLQDLPPATSQK